MPKKKRPFQFSFQYWGALFVTFLGATVMMLASLANGPDRDLTLSRTIPSALSPEHLDRQVSAITRWPQWFYSLAKVNRLPDTASGASDTSGTSGTLNHGSKTFAVPPSEITLKKGDLLDLEIDPKKAIWKQFHLQVQVTDYVPKRQLSLKIIGDSTGRLTRMFDRLEWKIEFTPKVGGGTVIRTNASAHTCHWRSRLFGGIAEKILLHQVFYPNILKLATLNQPFSISETDTVKPPF